MRSQRIQALKSLFLEKKQLLNTELCDAFHISIETVRRDLNVLEAEGFIRKIYGGARLIESSTTPLSLDQWDVRIDTNEAVKKRIAAVAARLIPDGSTVFLDSGTSVYEVARLLKAHKNLTVLTNSVRIAQELGSFPEIQVYFIGGKLHSDTLASFGFFASEFLSYFYRIDYTVLSCDGFIPEKGTTEYSVELASLKAHVLDKSTHVIVPVDHSKIGVNANCPCCETSRISTLITDFMTAPATVSLLREQIPQVIVATAE